MALAKVSPDVNWQLHIFGKGPRTPAWKSMAEKLALGNRCHFHGSQPRMQVMNFMSTSHLLLITSLKDLTSTVTIEAIAHGLPIICLDHCGFADVVNETCGIKVPLANPTQVTNDLTKAIEFLAQNEDFRHALAMGAQARSRDFNWDNKAKLIDRIYHNKIAEHKASKQ
jgi:glycosyltransferase involved in cell wall biosynthesis